MRKLALLMAVGTAAAAFNGMPALAANGGAFQLVPPVYLHFTDARGRPVTVGEKAFFPNGTNCGSPSELAALASDLQKSYPALAGLTYVNVTCGGMAKRSSRAAVKALTK